jgi:hypothetical protein
MSNKNYNIVVTEQLLERIDDTFLNNGRLREVTTGPRLRQQLGRSDNLTPQNVLNGLYGIKEPLKFAEEIFTEDGAAEADITPEEFQAMGEIITIVPVEIYDNGVWNKEGDGFKTHDTPLSGQLSFVAGALLQKGSPDYNEIVNADGEIDDEAYYKHYERKILPVLLQANTVDEENGAVVTIPGIGCGYFSGDFEGTEARVFNMLQRISEENQSDLQNIKAIVFDPNFEDAVENQRMEIGGISLISHAGHFGADNSQLRHPSFHGDEFETSTLVKIVAGDHLSYPGNDWAKLSRWSDEGTIGASTDLYQKITGVEGHYDLDRDGFVPTDDDRTWEEIILQENIDFDINTENLHVVNLDTNDSRPAGVDIEDSKTPLSEAKVHSKTTGATLEPGTISKKDVEPPEGEHDVIIYTDIRNGKPHLVHEFKTPSVATSFYENMGDVFTKTDGDTEFNNFMTMEDTSRVVASPSTGPGSAGVYNSAGAGINYGHELAISFGRASLQSEERRKAYLAMMDSLNDHNASLAPSVKRSVNALYAHLDILNLKETGLENGFKSRYQPLDIAS